MLLTDPWCAYLRIAEGCDNKCAYCVIPDIRGAFRSVPMEDVIAEAESLAACGVKELLVVAQDITRYGLDLYGKCSLAELLAKLEQVEGIQWIRLHYLYPDEMPDDLLEVIAQSKKILHYFDIPIQHINDRVLRSMNRREHRRSADVERARNRSLKTSFTKGREVIKEISRLCGRTKIDRCAVDLFQSVTVRDKPRKMCRMAQIHT